ncbi:hypothetical protein GEMRC1_009284 [Eukaryota sp. GEM-RC1]
MRLLVFVLTCLLIAATAQPYMVLKKGHSFIYDLKATVTIESTSTSGHAGSFAGYLYVKINSVSGSKDKAVYKVVANIVSGSNQAVGRPFSFNWKATGHISSLSIDKRDNTEMVQLKMAAANSLANTLIPSGKASKIKESTTLGIHMSNYKGSKETGHEVTAKHFSQDDIMQLADKSLDPKRVTLSAKANSKLNTKSKTIHSSRYQISVAWKPANFKTDLSTDVDPSNGDESNVDMVSKGTVTLTLRKSSNEMGKVTFTDDSLQAVDLDLEEPLLTEIPSEHERVFDDLFSAALAFLHVDPALNRDDVLTKDQIISKLVTGAKDLNMDILHEVVDDAEDAHHFDAGVYTAIRELATPEDLELTQAVAFVLTFAENVMASMELRKMIFSPLTSVAYVASRTAIYSDCNIVQDSLMYRSIQNDAVSEVIRFANKDFLTQGLNRKVLDFHKTWSFRKRFGGSIAGLELNSKVEAMSNLNCKNPTFDYLASASGNVDLVLLGHHKSAIRAIAEYGKIGGAPAENQIDLKIFGKSIYHKSFPSKQLDCSYHTIPVAHVAKGASVSYRIWVIVPIKISAGASLKADLSFQWKICDTDLSAVIRAVPRAGVTISGKVESNLFFIKAGAKLSGKFDMSIVPEAFIHGTKCELGFNVKMKHHPLLAQLQVYLKKKHCSLKFLRIKCKWKNKKNKTLFKYSRPERTKVLYEKKYPIKL